MELKEHTVKSYDKDLQSIAGTLDHMLDLLNESIAMVEETILDPKKQLAEAIISHDYKINHLDHLTEKKVTAMLALRQPMAFDLRYTISALKVSANLERMGDKCKSIIKNIHYNAVTLDDKTKKSLLEMLKNAKEMTRNAILSFNNSDQEKAEEVLKQDDKIDQIYKNLFSITEGSNFSGDQVKNIIDILFIAKSFERLADHATNIAEMVKYVISGEIVE